MIRREAHESGLGARGPGLRARLRPANSGEITAGPGAHTKTSHESRGSVARREVSTPTRDENYLIRASRRIQG
jgi:hypothetical protein